MNVKEKMTNVANAIRGLTLNSNPLSLNDMVIWLAKLTGYDISNVELSRITSDDKFTIMAESIRHATSVTRKLSLDDMAEILNAVVASDGKALYNTLEDAIVACDTGGTVTLLKDIDVGETSDVLIEKNITLDGHGHTLTREVEGGHLFVIKKSGVVLNVKNLKCGVNASVDKAFIHANALSANLNIENCELNSNDVVVYFKNVNGNTSIKNSIVKSKEQAFQFNYTTGTIKILNSSLHGNSSTDAVLHLYDSRSSISIEASQIFGCYAPAISLRYSNVPVTISDSYIQADYSNYLSAIDIHNCSPTVKLKGTSCIWIDSFGHASIRMRGSQDCDPTITLYDNVVLTDGVRSPIYYTTYAYRTGFHVNFADSYQSAKYLVLSTTDNTSNCCVWLENNPAIAFSHEGEAVYTYKLEYALEAQAKLGNLQYQYIDTENRWKLTLI